MNCIDALMSRRSIRRYTEEPVTEEEVDIMLRAAMAAPSAGNQQPWRFIVVRDRERLTRMSEATPYSGMLARAPLGIIVAGDTRGEKHPGYWVQDCSAAIQNLLVAAHSIGLGAVWIGVHPGPEREGNVRDICGVPDGVVPLGMVSVGRPAEAKPPSERFREDFVHKEQWGPI